MSISCDVICRHSRASGNPVCTRNSGCPLPRAWRQFSDYKHIHKFIDRSRFQAFLIAAPLQDRLAPLLRKASGEVGAEFRFEQGNAFVAAAAVTEGIFYRHLARL